MRSVRKTKASWRSGARFRSAGRKVVHGSQRSSAQRWFWWKKQSSHDAALTVFPIRRPSCTSGAGGATRVPANRSVFSFLQSAAFSDRAPQVPGFHRAPRWPQLRAGRIGKDVEPLELVTGATGYVGGRLVRRLVGEGRAVRALARNPARLERLGDGIERAGGDLISGRGIERALEGCETAYYLVH